MDNYSCPACGLNHGHPQIDADLYTKCKDSLIDKLRDDAARLTTRLARAEAQLAYLDAISVLDLSGGAAVATVKPETLRQVLRERANLRATLFSSRGDATVVDGILLMPTAFQIADEFDTAAVDAVTFVLTRGQDYNGTRVAVRRTGESLANDGKWEIEPQPSSRDDAFYARCRFASLSDAVAAYRKWKETT